VLAPGQCTHISYGVRIYFRPTIGNALALTAVHILVLGFLLLDDFTSIRRALERVLERLAVEGERRLAANHRLAVLDVAAQRSGQHLRQR
jgi:hypothetical protein